MPPLENPRHERFAQLRAGGKTGSDSYRAIAGKNARYADVRADQLMKMPGVRERIEELKTAAASPRWLSLSQIAPRRAKRGQRTSPETPA
jgi:hypothetical protein